MFEVLATSMTFDLPYADPRWVHPDGTTPNRIALIAEAPGREEVRQGKPLVGPSGEVNWQIAGRYAGLQRSQCYISNWRKIPFSDDEKKAITPEEKQAWTDLLHDELAMVKPEVVIAAGSWAVEALIGGEWPGLNLLWANGEAFWSKRGGFTVIPIVHPAAGLHNSDLLSGTVQGYQGVKGYLEAPTPNYRTEWASPPETVTYWGWGDPPAAVAIDTEGTPARPQCLTFTRFDDLTRAHYMRAGDPEVQQLFDWLQRGATTIYIQNALWDARVLAAMGVDIWKFPVVDTMILAYVLQNLPRDLKNLTKKLLNVDMVEFEKVVEPYYEEALATWRNEAYTLAVDSVGMVQQFTPKGKARTGKQAFKREGPALELSLVQHVERQQKMSFTEIAWATKLIGPPPDKYDLRLVPEELAIEYAGRDASVTAQLAPVLEARVGAVGLGRVVALDHSVLPLIDDMQRGGMHLDVERYWEVLSEVTTKRDRYIAAAREIVGDDSFNPGSADQVAAFCKQIEESYGALKLDRKTRGGKRMSTDDNALKLVKDDHPIVDTILKYREMDKQQGTYLMPLQALIKEGQGGQYRVYPNLRTTSVVSGRLSAHTPNVLAWPSRTEDGLKLRSIFTAPVGCDLVSWDLSQIELRIAAALSRDKVMCEAFQSGLDLHTNLAAKLFGVPYDQVDKHSQRNPCKTIHYLMLYGGGGDKLFEELRAIGVLVSRDDCFRWIRETWRVYSGCARFMRESAEEARRFGYVTDFLGRRRFLPATQLMGDRWPIAGLRYEAERQGGNFKMQAGAAELLKMAMDNVWRVVYPECRKQGIHFRLWLQVHDELMGELSRGAWEVVDPMIREAMRVGGWAIEPLRVDVTGSKGSHWGSLK